MAKLYSKQKNTKNTLPKKEAISFLLSYSKSLTVLKTKIGLVEIIAN
jgi:hypothetical protein